MEENPSRAETVQPELVEKSTETGLGTSQLSWRDSMIWRRMLIAHVCIALSLAGCSTMRPIELVGRSVTAVLAPGDSVQVWMRDGKVVELTLTAVDPDTLADREHRLLVKDIERIERREFSGWRTTLLVVAIGVLVFGVVVVSSGPMHVL